MEIMAEKANEISWEITQAVGRHFKNHPLELASALIGCSASVLSRVLGVPFSQEAVSKIASAGYDGMAECCEKIRAEIAERN